MKNIEVKGSFTEKKSRPASLNIPDRANKCLKHILENCDKNFNYVPYVGATLGENPPHFAHHRLDWTEVLPYSIYGMVIARYLTGNKEGEDIQLAHRRLLLSNFNELDGLIHAPGSPWNDRYPLCLWEQARALYALIYWYQDSGEELVLKYADGIVDGLYKLSYQEGRNRVFPAGIILNSGMGYYNPGTLIDPLTKYYEMTGSTKAFQLAQGLTYFMLDPRTGYFDKDYRFKGFFRAVAAVANGISRFASLTGEPELLVKAKALHERMLSQCTSYGSTPCTEPACSNMELNMSALSLVRAGFDEYWDQIDRFTRNQTAEAQFLDAGEWVREKALKGRRMDKSKWVTEFYPDDLHLLPYDDYTNVVQRCIGGFMWTSANEHLFIPASVMLCCASHAMRSFEIVWENALVEGINGVDVHLHFNCENSVGEVISYEPYRGKVSVILKKDSDLRVRIPEHACGKEITALEDNRKADVKISGRYVHFGRVEKGREYSLEYPLSPRITEEKQEVYIPEHYDKKVDTLTFQTRWRGNTVIEVLPESREEKRIYKRSHLDTDQIPYEDMSYFLPEKRLHY